VQPVEIRCPRTAQLLGHGADVARTKLAFDRSQMSLNAPAVGLDGPDWFRGGGNADGEH
jgi:hypothetical protein